VQQNTFLFKILILPLALVTKLTTPARPLHTKCVLKQNTFIGCSHSFFFFTTSRFSHYQYKMWDIWCRTEI